MTWNWQLPDWHKFSWDKRILREGPEGFKSGLSAGNYATITGASPATTTRDLADLVEKHALLREGERRHARYYLVVPVPKVPPVVLNEQGSFDQSQL